MQGARCRAPACLLRHALPAWLPEERTCGWLASNDEGAASVARFWPPATSERLARLPPRTRAGLVAIAQETAQDSILANLRAT
jgi:hypothetical protein